VAVGFFHVHKGWQPLVNDFFSAITVTVLNSQGNVKEDTTETTPNAASGYNDAKEEIEISKLV
jgi:hypothetical protein